MKTATLGQIQKLLTLIEGIPSDKVQEALGSPFLLAILCGKLDQILLGERWHLISLIADPKEIVVTKPHDVYSFDSDPRKANRYQIRVWKGAHGFFKGYGHVSVDDEKFSATGCPILLECYNSGPQQSPEALYPQAGKGNFGPNAPFFFPGHKWVKETKTVPGKGSFDVFTIRKQS